MRADRGAGHAVGTTLGALLAAVPLVLAGLWGAGHATHVVDLADGAAWLVSPERGLVSLVDAPTAQVAVTLRLPVADAATRVVQGRDGAYVVRGGTLARIDAATWTVGGAVVFGDEDATLAVVPGAGREAGLWVLDGRTVRLVDARTLQVRATADLRLGDDVRAVVDDRGDLWAADDERVVRVRHEHGGLQPVPQRGPGGELVLVQGRAVLVDVAAGTVRPLDGRAGVSCAQTRSRSPGAAVAGSSTSPEVFAAFGGALRVAGTDGAACGTVARVGDRDTTLGALAEVAGYVVATDPRTGGTTVVDRRTGALQTFALTFPGHRVELVVRGSTVFWNDLDGHASGLLELTGGAWRSTPVQKYDPATGAGAQVARTDTARPGPADADPETASFRIVSLTPDRALYAPGAPAVVTPEITGEPVPGEVWWWRFENLVTGAFEDFRTPGVPIAFDALPDVGEYATTLVVVRDGSVATATTTVRVVTWCALTVSTTLVDLAVDPTVQVSVDPACPVNQEITVATAPWLDADTSAATVAGASGAVTLRAVAEPPTTGPVAGALTLEVTGQPASQVRVDVVGAAP
ncbi:hypothetical protein [Cellulomonas phragmiteti]|uniref:PKD domain-containing protein n=1 Tax=Cellulomonas phragmiteti TaxID=478780 RepID=A0ABQ4DQ78_9CELL|nr:hypothetical protein [Cellulomonas phragmiteti]GIG41137.1 hypothetical protein Cph01nite_28990 [Cellulomonas phragmiteti]